MDGELGFVGTNSLRDSAEQGNRYLSLGFVLLDIIYELGGHDNDTFLVPPEHVDLLHLI